MTLEELLKLAGATLATVASALDADPDDREEVTGYEALTDVDVVDTPSGARVFLHGDDVALIYVGERALPADADPDRLRELLGSGERLRSRQGKKAKMHVVADKGVAWSEEAGELGFIELFPPTTFEDYQATIYDEPGPFIR